MENTWEELESDIRSQALSVTGQPVTIERLTGVGGPGVIRITGPKGQAIAKYLLRTEAVFYRDWAPRVRQRGLGVPYVYAMGENPTRIWILMEALHSTLTPPYHGKLSDMTAYLRKLHTIQRDRIANSAADHLPVRPIILTTDDIDDAITLWPERVRRKLAYLLHLPWPPLPMETQLISGDPNPTNWGWRTSGQLVLFDWSEAAWSHPAYDLAVLSGGLPAVALVKQVVESYFQASHHLTRENIDRWVAWVITARLVAFVWFAAWWRRGILKDAARPGLTMLQEGLVNWIGTVRPFVTAFLS